MMEIKERSHPRINNENYIATTTTASTIWSAEWNEFLSMHGDAAIAAFTCSSMKRHSINKCCHDAPF
jgi:hypothetical protein